MQRITSTEVQNAFGKYLALAEHEDIIITKNNTSIARLTAFREDGSAGLLPFPSDLTGPVAGSGESAGIGGSAEAAAVSPQPAHWRPHTWFDESERLLREAREQRHELIAGQVQAMRAPTLGHQVILSRLFALFFASFRDQSCLALPAPLDIELHDLKDLAMADPNLVQPDILVICDPDQVGAEGQYQGRPTLICEVLSAQDPGRDLISKLALYQRGGIREYWIVDPRQQCLLQYHFTDCRLDHFAVWRGAESVQAVCFAGFRLNLAEVFPQSPGAAEQFPGVVH